MAVLSSRDEGFVGCLIGDEAAPDLATQIACVQELEWSWIDLRRIDGRPVSELDDAEAADVAARLADAGISVRCICSAIGSRPIDADADADELRRIARFAERCGAGLVRVMTYPEAAPGAGWRATAIDGISGLARIAEDTGLVLAVENCVGYAATDPANAVDLFEAVASPAVGSVFDTGNHLAYGNDPMAYLGGVLPWLVHVHVKDGRIDGGDVTWLPPGEGEADVLGALGVIRRSGWSGPVALEPHVATQPHLDQWSVGGESVEQVVACGRALDRLLVALESEPREPAGR